MTTPRDLIAASLREIGVLAGGEDAPIVDSRDALLALNRMLDQWSLDRLFVPVSLRTVFPLTANVGEYAFGGGAAQPRLKITDGFDGEWVPSDSQNLSEVQSSTTSPPNWTIDGDGTFTVAKDAVIYQAGGASLRLQADFGSDIAAYRDFPVHSGEQVTFSIWLRTGGTTQAGAVVKIQNLDSGNYLAPDGTWQAASIRLFDTDDANFTRYWITFPVEGPTTNDELDTTLRVTFESQSVLGQDAWFDTLSFEAEGAFSSIPIPRPTFVDAVNLIDTSSSPDLEIPLGTFTDQRWQQVRMKMLTSTYPQGWHYNPTFPNGTLSFWPIPTGSGLKAAIYVPTQLVAFTDLSQEVMLFPGYENMIVKNLAMDLCPSYNRKPHPVLVGNAKESMAAVKRANTRTTEMTFPAGSLVGSRGRSRFSIFTG